MQSERDCLGRSGVLKPVAQGFATASAGGCALTPWDRGHLAEKLVWPLFSVAAAETAALRDCMDKAKP